MSFKTYRITSCPTLLKGHGQVQLNYAQIMFDKPKPPAVLHEAIYAKVRPFGVLYAVLQQELILYCGKLVATNKELFAGILNIRNKLK